MIYAAVGVVMLKPGWMTRYAPPIAQTYGADMMPVFGYVWAALMFATGAANLALAFSPDLPSGAGSSGCSQSLPRR